MVLPVFFFFPTSLIAWPFGEGWFGYEELGLGQDEWVLKSHWKSGHRLRDDFIFPSLKIKKKRKLNILSRLLIELFF